MTLLAEVAGSFSSILPRQRSQEPSSVFFHNSILFNSIAIGRESNNLELKNVTRSKYERVLVPPRCMEILFSCSEDTVDRILSQTCIVLWWVLKQFEFDHPDPLCTQCARLKDFDNVYFEASNGETLFGLMHASLQHSGEVE